jgi:hypothetical protein
MVLCNYDHSWREGQSPRAADPDGTKDNYWWFEYRKEQPNWSVNFWRVAGLLEVKKSIPRWAFLEK